MATRLVLIAMLLSPPVAAAEWTLESDTDPFTDESVHIARTAHIEGQNTRTFIVRCKDGKFDVYAGFDEFLDNDSVDVRYRVDKNSPVSESWFPSSSGTSVFAMDDASIARQLMSGSTLVIEAKDYRGVAHRTSFDLTGSRAAIEPVMRACGVSIASLDSQVKGLRSEVASEIEAWGPQQVSIGKEILVGLGKFDGPISSDMNSEFALALQLMNDDYIEGCRSGRVKGLQCDTMKIFWDANMEPVETPISSLLYELGKGVPKERFGKLRMGE